MRQLVGESCVLCRGRIDSVIEGRFCRQCGCPVHNTCVAQAIASPLEGRCTKCGSRQEDAQHEQALHAGHEKESQDLAKHHGARRLTCPGCGATHGFQPVPVDAAVPTLATLLGSAWAGLALYQLSKNRFQCQHCGQVFRAYPGTTPRRPRVWEWLLSIGIVCLGLAILGIHFFSAIRGTTPEQELTPAEGVASDVTITAVPGRAPVQVLKFTIGGYRTEYASDRPKYDEVKSAVASGQPLRAWVSTKQETVFPRAGWVPLYKLSAGDKPILEYGDVIAHEAKGSQAMLIGAIVVLAIGTFGILSCIRASRRSVVKPGSTA